MKISKKEKCEQLQLRSMDQCGEKHFGNELHTINFVNNF